MTRIKQQKIFVVARNAYGRPMLQHRVLSYSDLETVCGVQIGQWSREWSHRVFHPMFACKRCNPGACVLK